MRGTIPQSDEVGPRAHRPRSRWTKAAVATVAVVIALVIVSACQPVPPGTSTTTTTPSPPASVTLVGHGWGHGRGMGQYGAYGLAVNYGWSGTAILNQFYGGTRTATVAASRQRVYLTAQAGQDLIITNTLGRMTTSANDYATHFTALRIHRVDSSHFQLFTGTSCSGPWSHWTALRTASAIRVRAAAETTNDPRAMLQLCTPSGTRYYRGDLLAERVGSTIETVNDVDTEDLVRSVIAREISASWADAGGGRGAAAVRAQAVATRSYAVAGDSRFAPWATTCDSTLCQYYSGYGTRRAGSSTIVKVEDPRTDLATTITKQQVRVFLSNDHIARTEFSSSSGGYSAGGVFPVALDQGDATTANPNHTWTVTFSHNTMQVELAAYVGHSLGTYEGITVLSRNGYGDEGGRVNSLRVVFSRGSATLTGKAFESLLGLKSDWFAVKSTS